MAAMARSLGIPARIGVGFTAGTPTGDGEYEVRMNQAHAWPELYFEGAGWVRFEPTPGGPAGDPPPWTTEGSEGEDDAQETEAPEEESSPEPTPGAEESAPQETQDPETAEDGEPAG